MGEGKKEGDLEERGMDACNKNLQLAEYRNPFLGSINIHADKQKFPGNEEALGARYVLIGERIDSKLTRYVIGLSENLWA